MAPPAERSAWLLAVNAKTSMRRYKANERLIPYQLRRYGASGGKKRLVFGGKLSNGGVLGIPVVY
ncbi:hypothetical protein DXA13_03210 [Clostridium sp. AM58-1XD]|nr:hypothetical protein DXA13_03210 [Clostridium sp. AM58-1XD]